MSYLSPVLGTVDAISNSKTMVHHLKTLPNYFQSVRNRTKSFEIRINDRNFQVGDTLILKEFNGVEYTGAQLTRSIIYILQNDSKVGLSDGYCIMSIK